MERLRATAETELLEAIDAGLVEWEKRHLEPCARALADRTGMAAEMIAFGLKRFVTAHRLPHLRTWLHRAQAGSGRSMPASSKVLLSILSGNVPGLVIPASIECLLARCPVLLKAARGDTVVPSSWIGVLREAHPVFGEAVRWEYWKGGEDPRESRRLREADMILASGTQRTMDSLEGRIAVPWVRHGPKFSIGVVGSEWRKAPDSWWKEVARECVLWEQQGCLSPLFLFVEGDMERFARTLAEAFSWWEAFWPPPPETAEKAVFVRDFRAFFDLQPPGSGGWVGGRFTVGWSPGVSPLPPGGRCLGIHPREAVKDVFEGRFGRIQAIGTALDPSLPAAPVVFPLVRIQDPPAGWRADGRSILEDLFA